MGTAGNIRSWSLVQGNCRCGLRACQNAQRESWKRREAIAEALDFQFDEPARMVSVGRPLLLLACDPMRLAS
jgi:hypothetical protein